MAFQPPTRPHSANPHVILNASVFARPSSAASNHSRQTSLQSTSASLAKSKMSRGKEADWEDPWDSGSDHEGNEHDDERISGSGSSSSNTRSLPVTAPIPIRNPKASRSSTSISASWASTSYQYIPPPPTRPGLPNSKTFTEGAIPPLPGTVLEPSEHTAGSRSTGQAKPESKLPPGGAWEIVEPTELTEEVTVPPPRVGKEAIRDEVDDILNDPLQLLSSLSLSASVPSTPSTNTQSTSTFPFFSPSNATRSNSSVTASPEATTSSSSLLKTPKTPKTPGRKEGVGRQRSVRTERRREKFAKVLRGRAEEGHAVDLAELRRLAWSGTPDEVRPIVWQLLLNYLPLPSQPRLTTLHRKRKEYSLLVDQYFGRGLGALDQQMWHQIEIDVPRTRPGVPLWSCLTAQRSLERILYVWAIRHPASGYVQGINDLVTPFFQVFLSAYIDTDPELFDVGHLDATVLSAIEADSFWCLSKLLDGIQDNYISQQPGIQRLVKRMSELVKRIDAPLAAHFEEQGVEFMQFAFRWMNCLLMREISVKCTVRMWDTYLAEGTDAFSQFHLYVCSALLVKFSDRLREMDFQEMIIFLQCLPTHSWTDHDIELLLSEAYVLKTVWQGAENHFANVKANGGGFGMLGR